MELIHHLISFPKSFIETYTLYNEKGYKELENNRDLYFHWLRGGVNRGSFTDKEKLIDIIKRQNDPYGICEGYYEYLLIETHQLNVIDGCLFEPDYTNEMWFKFVKIDEDNWKYQEIPRPECLMGTCGFL